MQKRKTDKTETEKAIATLYDLCHTYIRKRDSKRKTIFAGNCFDCGIWCEGQNFQAGHFIASSKGALTRYHPLNIHGQAGGCNIKYQQEWVKINYTLAMIKKYGKAYVDKLKRMSQKSIKADIIFYNTLIDLYKKKDEKGIIKYLESL